MPDQAVITFGPSAARYHIVVRCAGDALDDVAALLQCKPLPREQRQAARHRLEELNWYADAIRVNCEGLSIGG